MKTGKGLIDLEFWNVLYAEGVQDLRVQLQVLHRGDNFMVGRFTVGENADRVAILSHIEFGWLDKFCPELVQAFPPGELGGEYSGSVSLYLDAVFLDDPPLPHEPEDLNDGRENDWMAACALRFDGYACAKDHGWEHQPSPFSRALLAGEMPVQTMEERFTAMFMLQRFLMKEGVQSKTDEGWKRFRELFLELAAEAVPVRYQAGSWLLDWEKRFAPVVAAGKAFITHLHQNTVYDAERL